MFNPAEQARARRGRIRRKESKDYPTGALPKLLTVAAVAELQSLSLQLPTSKE